MLSSNVLSQVFIVKYFKLRVLSVFPSSSDASTHFHITIVDTTSKVCDSYTTTLLKEDVIADHKDRSWPF